MCQCGHRSCALCQAKWAAPVVLKSHQTGDALLPIDVDVADLTVEQNGRVLKSKIYGFLKQAQSQSVSIADIPRNLREMLIKYVTVHCSELIIVDGELRSRRCRSLIPKDGFKGVPLSQLLTCPEGAEELQLALASGSAIVLPGTQLVFSTEVARPQTQLGPVFAGAIFGSQPP